MIRLRGSLLALLVATLGLVAPGTAEPQRRVAPRRGAARATPRLSEEQNRLAQARAAMAQDRIEEAREAVSKILPSRMSPRDEEGAAYLKAVLLEEGEASDQALAEYLKQFPRGEHRRAATLLLAKGRFAGGDYREAENLLSVFSPGVEQDPLGREALVWRGLAQLGRGEAEGALQFLQSARRDLDASSEEEAYYFALSQAALRAGRPGEAIEALKVLLSRHANGDYAPQALFAMGQALEVSGRPADGAALLRQVAQRFPESYEATRARDRGIRLSGAESAMRPLGGGFAVQIGAFTRREGAERLGQDLRLSGVGDVSVIQGRETPPIYRVRAGAFDARDEARALGERLRRERGLSFTIVPR
jgi:TolA-binding protein